MNTRKPAVTPEAELRFLRGIGPRRGEALARLNLHTVGDLLYHFPRAYQERPAPVPIFAVRDGHPATVCGEVAAVEHRRLRKKLELLRVTVTDGTAGAAAVWFNQTYLAGQFQPGRRVTLFGKVSRRFGEIRLQNPEFQFEGAGEPSWAGTMVPVYPLTGGLTQAIMRNAINQALDLLVPSLEEYLPAELRHRQGLVALPAALRDIHFPDGPEALAAARKRLVFGEFFLLQLALVYLRRHADDQAGIALWGDGRLLKRFIEVLPFRLTAGQGQVAREILKAMAAPKPMNRLVMGDVGSGKTVLAQIALVRAVEAGYQGALMVPTEVLAEQHHQNMERYLAPLGIRTGLLTGSTGPADRREVLAGMASGDVAVVVGTHALIQEKVEFARLGLVVTDEQHRFGVRQRAGLRAKGTTPDVLVMTATPIPRTLALTLYGDLEISTLRERPPGRRPVGTSVHDGKERGRIYAYVRGQVKAGFQAYVVCPLVEDSERLEARAAVSWAGELRRRLPECTVGLIHGAMATDERDEVMRLFRQGRVDILVATTVVEVGVDVPRATIMVVEDADRFGLAQLHQLRGRVGRGSVPSRCFLVTSAGGREARERLEILTKTDDGFEIAAADLRLRGPGEFFGVRQHGVPEFALADPIGDLALLEQAQAEAHRLAERDPALKAPANAHLGAKLREKYGPTSGFAFVG